MKTTEKPVRVTADFDQSQARLWEALTNHSQMVQWFFENIPDFKAEKGFKTRFTIHSGGRDFEHIWHIAEVNPLNKIVFDWSYTGHPGRAQVIFELSGGNISSRIQVTHKVLEDFPDNIPEFQRKNCMGGWQYFIGERLSTFLK